MINTNTDFAKYAHLLEANGRVQIPNYLEASLAESLFQCLLDDVDWDLAYRINDDRIISSKELNQVSSAQIKNLKKELHNIEPNKYSYMYHSYMMVTAYIEKRNPGLLLDRFLEMLNSSNYLDFLHQLTGQTNIIKINAQATKYIQGDFLKPHNDFNASEGREYAYVINLTKDWKNECGGQLCFLDDKGDVEESFFPSFNSLSIFKVPKMHKVSKVINTNNSRYSITGWLLNK